MMFTVNPEVARKIFAHARNLQITIIEFPKMGEFKLCISAGPSCRFESLLNNELVFPTPARARMGARDILQQVRQKALSAGDSRLDLNEDWLNAIDNQLKENGCANNFEMFAK